MEFHRSYKSVRHNSKSPVNSQKLLDKIQHNNEKTPSPSTSYNKRPLIKSAPYSIHSRTHKILTNSNQHNRSLGTSNSYSNFKQNRRYGERPTSQEKPTQSKYSFKREVNKNLFPTLSSNKSNSITIKKKSTVVLPKDNEDDPYGACQSSDDDADLFPIKSKVRKTATSQLLSDKENTCSDSNNSNKDTFKFKKLQSENDQSFNKSTFFSNDGTNDKINNNNNDIFGSPDKQCLNFNTKITTPRSYTNKKKCIQLKKSKLLCDISPVKLDNAYRSLNVTFTSSKDIAKEEKENVPTNVLENVDPLPSHLIGFPNFGNTCYLNAVMQSLVGLPSFTEDYQELIESLHMTGTSTISQSVKDIISNKHSGHSFGLKKALRTIKGNLEKIDQSFSGCKMQDANEFLTRILDTIKDEIDSCCSGGSSPSSSVLKSSSPEPCSTDCNDDSTSSSSSPSSAQDLMTSLQINGGTDKEVNVITQQKNPVKNNFEFQLLESYSCLGCYETEGRLQEYFGLYVNLPSNTCSDDVTDSLQEAINNYMKTDERELTCDKCGHDKVTVTTSFTSLPRILVIQLKRYEFKPDLFECIKVSSNISINKWLELDSFTTDNVSKPSAWSPSLNKSYELKSPDVISRKEDDITPPATSPETPRVVSSTDVDQGSTTNSPVKDCQPSSSNSEVNESPPVIAISDEDSDFQKAMKESLQDLEQRQVPDDIDDDLQQAIKLSLIDMGMCFKQDTATDASAPQDIQPETDVSLYSAEENSYRLVSIISHFGDTTTTGHYVSDVYNYDVGEWFHYDDEVVTRIAESHVLAGGRQRNGYIFFYVHKDLFAAFTKRMDSNKS